MFMEKTIRKEKNVATEEKRMSDENFSIKEYLIALKKDMNDRFDSMDNRFASMNNRLDKQDTKITEVTKIAHDTDKRLAVMEGVSRNTRWIIGIIVGVPAIITAILTIVSFLRN